MTTPGETRTLRELAASFEEMAAHCYHDAMGDSAANAYLTCAAAVGGVSDDRITHALAVQGLDDGSEFAGGYNECLADVRAILEGGKR